MKEFIKKNKTVVAVSMVILAIFVTFVFYGVLSGNKKGGVSYTSPPPVPSKTPTPNPAQASQQQIVSNLPSVREAREEHKQALIQQGRYVSSVIEPPVPVQPVTRPQNVKTEVKAESYKESEKAKAVKTLWAKFYESGKTKSGGLLAQKAETQKCETQKTEVEKEPAPEIPLYDMVKAYLKLTSSSLFPGYPVVAVISDPRFPRGTMVVGKLTPNYAATRLEVAFEQLIYPDGRQVSVRGLGYSIDESPGIASLDIRGDIAGAELSVAFDAIRNFAQAFRKDETITRRHIWGEETEVRKSDDRLREAGLASLEGATQKAEQFVDTELRKNKYKENIVAEKFLPIYVMFVSKNQ